MRTINSILAAVALAAPVIAWAETCAVIDAAVRNQVGSAEDAVTIADNVFRPPNKPSQMSCLDSIIAMGGNRVISIPSLSDIVGGLLDRACAAMEEAWNEGTREISERAQLPYGLGSIARIGGYEVDVLGPAREAINEAGRAVTDPVNDAFGQARDRIDSQDPPAADSLSIYGNGNGNGSSGNGSIY